MATALDLLIAQRKVKMKLDKEEEELYKFDCTSVYGPKSGITRMQRWDRASKLGLNPPEDVRRLLQADMKRNIKYPFA